MKKLLIAVLALLLLLPSMVVSAGKALRLGDWGIGDLNNDAVEDAKDYMILKRHVLKTYELSGILLCRADVNLDGEVDAKDYMVLKRVAMGTYERNQLIYKSFSEISDEELRAYISSGLAYPREKGIIYFGMDEGLDAEAVRGVLQSLGLPTDFESNELYVEVYDTDGYSFVICVSEEDICNVMLKLYREEAVAYCAPGYLSTPD